LPAQQAAPAAFCPSSKGELEDGAPLLLDGLDGLDATGDDWPAGALFSCCCAITTPGSGIPLRYPRAGWRCECEGIDYEPLQSALIQHASRKPIGLTVPCSAASLGPGCGAAGAMSYFKRSAGDSAVDLGQPRPALVCYSLGRLRFRCMHACAASAGAGPLLLAELGWKTGANLDRAIPQRFTWSLCRPPEGHICRLINRWRRGGA